MFRKMRGVHVPPDKQGLLFFLCRNYKDLPEKTQQRINELCDSISEGERAYRAALFDMLTTRESVVSISMKHAVSQSTLYKLRRKFYETWYKEEAGS